MTSTAGARASAARWMCVAVTALGMAACGSQVDPEVVRLAQGGSGSLLSPTGADGAPAGSSAAPIDGTGAGAPAPIGGAGGTAEGSESPAGTGAAAPVGDTTGGSPSTAAGARDCRVPEEGPGITGDSITIGNAADISGPQPGIFEAAQSAVRAYVAFVNASGGVCGRRLELVGYDTRTDGAAEQQAYTDGCEQVFAMVGSMSAFDGAGAAVTESCGLPDIRAAAVTTERNECAVCFGTLPANPTEFQNAVPDMVLQRFPAAAKRAAMLWINIGAAPASAQAQARILEQRGMHFVYLQSVDIAEFNYAPYVQQMKDRGVRSIQMIGSPATMVRLAQTMRQQDYWPDVYLIDPTVYSPEYVGPGGDDVEGTITFTNTVPFEQVTPGSELRLYLDWLERIRPGAVPTFFGLYAWSAAKLFVEQVTRLGPRLSRATFVDALGQVDGWTAGGLHAPQPVGRKRVGECWRFLQLSGGTWLPFAGDRYSCRGTTVLD